MGAANKRSAIVYSNDTEKGQVRFCEITRRNGDTTSMFYYRTDGTIVANLVGYRITPLTDEEMRALGYGPAGYGGE